jgi:hypothetical protein
MQLKHFTLCAVSLATGGAQAQAQQFVQVNSLKQLPAAVQQQLGVGNAADPIADRGEPFNGACVIVDATPRRRFLMGALGTDVVVVAVEVGGFAHDSVTTEWRRHGEHWIKQVRRSAPRFPKTLQELLQDSKQPVLTARN